MVVHHKSAGFVIYKDVNSSREYLILHYPGGHWDYPKGHVEEDDDNELGTALRELEEETGLSNVEVVPGFMSTIGYKYRHNGELQDKTVDFFLAKALSGDVGISHEHIDFLWLPFEQAIEKLTFDNAKDVLISAKGFLDSL